VILLTPAKKPLLAGDLVFNFLPVISIGNFWRVTETPNAILATKLIVTQYAFFGNNSHLFRSVLFPEITTIYLRGFGLCLSRFLGLKR